jgi:hypothetical protein
MSPPHGRRLDIRSSGRRSRAGQFPDERRGAGVRVRGGPPGSADVARHGLTRAAAGGDEGPRRVLAGHTFGREPSMTPRTTAGLSGPRPGRAPLMAAAGQGSSGGSGAPACGSSDRCRQCDETNRTRLAGTCPGAFRREPRPLAVDRLMPSGGRAVRVFAAVLPHTRSTTRPTEGTRWRDLVHSIPTGRWSRPWTCSAGRATTPRPCHG